MYYIYGVSGPSLATLAIESTNSMIMQKITFLQISALKIYEKVGSFLNGTANIVIAFSLYSASPSSDHFKILKSGC